CQKRRVLGSGECTLREICRNQDCADSEPFATCFASSFRFPGDRARRGADDSFRRAPKQETLEATTSSRRKHDQIGMNLAGQKNDLLVRLPATYVAILWTKRRRMFLVNSCQFLVKPFDRLGCLEKAMVS